MVGWQLGERGRARWLRRRTASCGQTCWSQAWGRGRASLLHPRTACHTGRLIGRLPRREMGSLSCLTHPPLLIRARADCWVLGRRASVPSALPVHACGRGGFIWLLHRLGLARRRPLHSSLSVFPLAEAGFGRQPSCSPGRGIWARPASVQRHRRCGHPAWPSVVGAQRTRVAKRNRPFPHSPTPRPLPGSGITFLQLLTRERREASSAGVRPLQHQ